jgi:hypothetical protein
VVVQRGERLLHRRRRKERQPGEGRDDGLDHEGTAPQRPSARSVGGQQSDGRRPGAGVAVA